jgi:Icc-related predicted phosphoesterase
MAILTALNCADIHTGIESERPYNLEAVIDLSKKEKVDIVLNAGDLVDAWQYVNRHLKRIQEAVLSEEEAEVLIQNQGIAQWVAKEGEENIRKVLENMPSEENQKILSELEKYISNKDAFLAAAAKFKKGMENPSEEIKTKTLEEIAGHISMIDKKLKEFEAPVISVAGNHDPDFVYEMKNTHYLEKKGAVNARGLTIDGTPNTNEIVPHLPEEFYRKENDDFHPDVEGFIEQFGTEEDLQNFKTNNAVYKRMKKADLVLAHKKPQRFSVDSEGQDMDTQFGYGAGLMQIIKDTNPSVILSGHTHGREFFSTECGYEMLRASHQRAYVLEINTETKQIERIKVYRRVYEEATNPALN